MNHLKSNKHDHFWIINNTLYESYKTIRGLRYREVCYVDYPDTEKLSEVDQLIVGSQIYNTLNK